MSATPLAGQQAVVGPVYGWASYVFVFLVVILVTTFGFWITGHDNNYLLFLFGHPWVWVPQFYRPLVARGGLIGLFFAFVLGSVYWILLSLATAIAAYWLARPLIEWWQAAHPQADLLGGSSQPNGGVPPADEFLGLVSKDVEIIIRPVVGGPVFRNVYPSGYLRLKREHITLKEPPTTALGHFEVALTEVLGAHRDWTSDPEGHHANVGLLKHSLDVAERLRAALPTEPLAFAVGLAHDLGKLLAYGRQQREDGSVYWAKKTAIQDRLSAQVVRTLEEFRQLPAEDQNTVNIVLTYTHSPSKLPRKSTSAQTLRLLDKLREVDGLVTARDQAQVHLNATHDAVIADIVRVLPNTLAALNINQSVHQEAKADGWTLVVLDYVAVQADALREHLYGRVAEQTATALSLGVNPTPHATHPATPALKEALSRMNLLITEFGGGLAEDGLFSVRVFKIAYDRVFLLKRERLAQVVDAERLERWGDCKYHLTVLGPSANRRATRPLDD